MNIPPNLDGSGGYRKRKRGDRPFRFKSFCESGHPVEFDGPFQSNVRTLLQFGQPETNPSSGLQTWCFPLQLHHHPPMHISLFVIEEPMDKSLHRSCHHCRCVGWGHHMTCNRRFHFVLPSTETTQTNTACSNGDGGDGGDQGSDEVLLPKPSIMEAEGHLMHGVFHPNGFGHLLCINGVEKGSGYVTGSQIMDLWHRICSALRARRVSLTDVAKKRSMELRLIHGVAYGETWFGRWGYRFGRGTYGVTQQMHHKAIEALRGIPLCLIVHNFAGSGDIIAIIAKYQAMASCTLQTLGQLLRFIMELKKTLPQDSTASVKNAGGLSSETATCRWSSKRVEKATRVIVEALKNAESKWVSRQEVRDAARMYIGDTGLLDFVLKSLGNHVVGNYMVRRTVNPVTKVLEYCLEDVSLSIPSSGGMPMFNNSRTKAQLLVSRMQLVMDLLYLYKYLLEDFRPGVAAGVLTAIPTAVRMVLDGKHLVKDYHVEQRQFHEDGIDVNLRLMCTVWLRNVDQNEDIREGRITKVELVPPHHELLVQPAHVTIGELKMEVQRLFRDLYRCLRSFVAEYIVDVNGKDSDLVYGLVESGSSLMVAGTVAGPMAAEDKEEIYEGGNIDNWEVDCLCGTKDYDGEQMVSCDICEVWQHLRCVQLPEEVPQIFICARCENNIAVFPSLL